MWIGIADDLVHSHKLKNLSNSVEFYLSRKCLLKRDQHILLILNSKRILDQSKCHVLGLK